MGCRWKKLKTNTTESRSGCTCHWLWSQNISRDLLCCIYPNSSRDKGTWKLSQQCPQTLFSHAAWWCQQCGKGHLVCETMYIGKGGKVTCNSNSPQSPAGHWAALGRDRSRGSVQGVQTPPFGGILCVSYQFKSFFNTGHPLLHNLFHTHCLKNKRHQSANPQRSSYWPLQVPCRLAAVGVVETDQSDHVQVISDLLLNCHLPDKGLAKVNTLYIPWHSYRRKVKMKVIVLYT